MSICSWVNMRWEMWIWTLMAHKFNISDSEGVIMYIFYCCLDSFLNTLHVTLDNYIRYNSFFFPSYLTSLDLKPIFHNVKCLICQFYSILYLYCCFVLFCLNFSIGFYVCYYYIASYEFWPIIPDYCFGDQIASYSTFCHLVFMITKIWPPLGFHCWLIKIFAWTTYYISLISKMHIFPHFYLFEIMS